MDSERRDFIKMLIKGETMSSPIKGDPGGGAREEADPVKPAKHRHHHHHHHRPRAQPGGGGCTPQRLPRQDSRTLRLHRQNSDERTATYWPKECGNKAVQELDGNFFESFTALVWKQENRRRRVASLDEKEAKDPPPSESRLGPRQKIEPLSRKEFELLYIEVLYTIKHKIGATTGGHLPFIHDLFVYAQESFGVTPEEHARFLARASEEKPPILILNVVVIDGRDLEAKDPDGFSDPYCMLGIIPSSRAMKERLLDGSLGASQSSDEEAKMRKESALKKFSQSFKKKWDGKTVRDLIPVKFIRTTTVKNNTLNPVWNEKFRFDLEDSQRDRLHLDIWDHDDEFSVVDAAKTLNEVQGLKGLGRYFKQIAQSARSSNKTNVDDFLGSVNIRLDDIPSTGVGRWCELEARTSRSNVEGQIHLELSLATREDRGFSEEDNWNDIQQHEDLIGIFIDYEMRKFKYEMFRWTGELSKAATTILHQHAIQGDITDVQQAMCRWSTYSKKHRERPFDWSTLLKLLDDLHEKWEPASLSRDEEEILGRSFEQFLDYGLGLIARQRDVYPPANKAAQCRLEFIMRCFLKIHSMDVFRQCCPFRPSLQTDIANVLKRSTLEWYQRLHHQKKSVCESEDDALTAIIVLIDLVNSDLTKALQYYTPLYERVLQLDYFSIVFMELEKTIGDNVMRHLDERTLSPDVATAELLAENVSAQQTGMQLFELYLALQEFCDMKEHLSAKDQLSLSITQYYEWYKVPMQRWISMSRFKAMKRIKRAVDLDKVGQVDGNIKQSTSAIDVACCFGQIIDFWRKIRWPDPVGALPFVSQITKDLCEGATYYADLIHAKLRAAGYYDEVGQFDVTEQLCITINDIEQVRRSLKPLPDALNFSDIIFASEKQLGEQSGKAARGALCGAVRAADEQMIHKIKQVVDHVAGKMRPDIKKDVFHLCWAPEKQPPDEAISDLLNYLDSNLVTLNTNLLSSNFKRILDSIWVEVLEEIAGVIETEDGKMTYFFERLFDALDILVDFFHADEKGLSMAAIKNNQFEDLHWQLTLNKAETSDVIAAYYLEKLHEQEQSEPTAYGSLSVRLYYNAEAEILLVEVLNAKNVLALDPNGLSDPFVLVEIAPNYVFPKLTVQQTQVVKNTLNPTFDASFEFCVSRQQLRQAGTCVVFTVMDHDFMLSNDFAGEALFALCGVPGAKGEQISGFVALKPVSLILTQPSRMEKTRASAAITSLQLRAGDKEAQDFVKKRRQIEAQARA